MTDRVHPSSKPAATATAATAAVAPSKAQFYRPYNPPPSQHRQHKPLRRCTPCRFCFWTILVILVLLLISAIVTAILYLLYHPHKPSFSVSSLETSRFNLTSSESAATLSSSFTLTLLAKNPNSHTFTYSFEPAAISFLSSSHLLGKSSLPAFMTSPKNNTAFRNVIVSGDFHDLDADTVMALRANLRRKNGVPLTVRLDTKVGVKAGRLRSKKVGVRVTCNGFEGVVVPKGRAVAVASVRESKCEVDLRIKIWKFTF